VASRPIALLLRRGNYVDVVSGSSHAGAFEPVLETG